MCLLLCRCPRYAELPPTCRLITDFSDPCCQVPTCDGQYNTFTGSLSPGQSTVTTAPRKLLRYMLLYSQFSFTDGFRDTNKFILETDKDGFNCLVLSISLLCTSPCLLRHVYRGISIRFPACFLSIIPCESRSFTQSNISPCQQHHTVCTMAPASTRDRRGKMAAARRAVARTPRTRYTRAQTGERDCRHT